MSNTPPPELMPTAASREIKLISHSNLFYWWPVWFFGFVFAIWTLIEGNHLAIVPPNAKVIVRQTESKTEYEVKYETKQKFITAENATITSAQVPETSASKIYPAHVSEKAWIGSLFVLILVLTVVITNVPLRGLWSFMVIVLIVLLALIISLFNAWDRIFSLIGGLHIYINMAGYLFIAGAVFIVWAVATYIFDRRAYIIFTPGQVKVCEHIGDAVRTYDTMGMTFEKQRDDLFRHYILGFGSGDLIVRTSGAERQEIKIQNVLGIGWKLKAVENLIREKSMVQS